LATSPAAEGRLNSPWLKEKLRPVFAQFRARRVVGCDTEEQQRGIRIVRIVRDIMRDRRRRWLWSILLQPSLALYDPFHDLAHSHALACQGILIGSMLKCLLHRDLTGADFVIYGQSLFYQHLER